MDFFSKKEDVMTPAATAQTPEVLPVIRELQIFYSQFSGNLYLIEGRFSFEPNWLAMHAEASSRVIRNFDLRRSDYKANNDLFPFEFWAFEGVVKKKTDSYYTIEFSPLNVIRRHFYYVTNGLVFSEADDSLVNTAQGLLGWVSSIKDVKGKSPEAHNFFCQPGGSLDWEGVLRRMIEKELQRMASSSGYSCEEWLERVAGTDSIYLT